MGEIRGGWLRNLHLDFRDSEKHGCGYPFRLYRRAHFERSDFRLYSTRGEDDVSRRRGWCVGRGDEWRRYGRLQVPRHGTGQGDARTKRSGGYKKIVNGVVGRMPSDFKGTVANDIINRVFITD